MLAQLDCDHGLHRHVPFRVQPAPDFVLDSAVYLYMYTCVQERQHVSQHAAVIVSVITVVNVVCGRVDVRNAASLPLSGP